MGLREELESTPVGQEWNSVLEPEQQTEALLGDWQVGLCRDRKRKWKREQ